MLDGEIVHLGKDGRPLFYDLMRRRTPQHFAAFYQLWLNGRVLRHLPLLERKALLRRITPPQPSPDLYVDHGGQTGVALFQEVCKRDLEGIVAKLATGPYTPDATTWVKIKNRRYSQKIPTAICFGRSGLTVRRREGSGNHARLPVEQGW